MIIITNYIFLLALFPTVSSEYDCNYNINRVIGVYYLNVCNEP